MLGLVVSQTMRRGWRAGNLAALTPLITDAPIILAAFFVIRQLPHADLGWIGLAGGLFVIYLGAETLQDARKLQSAGRIIGSGAAGSGESSLASLWRGVLTNALNPHPYLFWAIVGAPLLVSGYEGNGIGGVAAFIGGFYVLLVVSKLAVALVVDRGRRKIGNRPYQTVLAGSGLMLLALGILLFAEGVGAIAL